MTGSSFLNAYLCVSSSMESSCNCEIILIDITTIELIMFRVAFAIFNQSEVLIASTKRKDMRYHFKMCICYPILFIYLYKTYSEKYIWKLLTHCHFVLNLKSETLFLTIGRKLTTFISYTLYCLENLILNLNSLCQTVSV